MADKARRKRAADWAAKTGDVWQRRYREINDWERYLGDNGFRIVKLFLNVAERARWDDYQHAYSELLSNTSTEWAPWHAIPADRKWFARIGVGAVLVHALMEIDPHYPAMSKQQHEVLDEVREALKAQAPNGAAPDPFEQELSRSASAPGLVAGA